METVGSEVGGTLEPIVKTSWVRLPVEQAFELFTVGIASWWPLDTYSIGEEKAKSCVLEGKQGGRIYEIMDDGSEAEWGKVTTWEPPHKLAFTWHAGRDEATAQLVEVTFRAYEDGTEFELIHSGWELLGDAGVTARESYERGWDTVLGQFRGKART